MPPRKKNRTSQEKMYFIAPSQPTTAVTAPQPPQPPQPQPPQYSMIPQQHQQQHQSQQHRSQQHQSQQHQSQHQPSNPQQYYGQQPPIMTPQQLAMMAEYEIGTAANALCAFAHDLRMVQMSMHREDNETKVFVHRTGMEWTNVDPRTSSIMNNDVGHSSSEHSSVKKEIFDSPSLKDSSNASDLALLEPTIDYPIQDVIFANGNNREKRRVEVFEYYSELYKYKEHHRDSLYNLEKVLMDEKLREHSIPRQMITEVGEDEDENDICERRDLELLRLRYWRRFQRNENIRLYYKETHRIHKDATQALNIKLERLKQHLLKQAEQLDMLDRDITDISSGKTEKLYRRADLTQSEFDTITADPTSQQQRGQQRGPSRGQGVQNNSESESDRRRTDLRESHLINRVMKKYVSPDDLGAEDVEHDLAVLRSLSKNQ